MRVLVLALGLGCTRAWLPQVARTGPCRGRGEGRDRGRARARDRDRDRGRGRDGKTKERV